MEEYKNGTARLIDIKAYLDWLEALSKDEVKAKGQELLRCVNREPGKTFPDESAIRQMFDPWIWSPDQQAKTRKEIEDFISYGKNLGMPFRVGRWVPSKYAFLYLGNPGTGVIIVNPEKYLEYVPEKDFSDMTPAQILASSHIERGDMSTSILPQNLDGLTPGRVGTELKKKKSDMDLLKKRMQDVRDASEESLIQLKREIEAKQAELQAKQQKLMEKLQIEQEEMEGMIEQMEDQIFLLDSQIYAIRCYTGEVVTLTQIRSGKNAPDNEPIIIHQKLRFLDEDLGRAASLYEISWHKLNLFEDFLRFSPAALDLFAPNERCVVLVRLSKNDQTFHNDDRFPGMNILKAYNRYHGKTIGIIIRNGENLYLGWTDEERVHIKDDFIVTQVITETVPVWDEDSDKPLSQIEERNRTERRKKERREKREFMDGIVSRIFVYNVLQGIVDSSNLMPLPKGVKLNKPSQYVVFSVADRWLTDTRFGSFTEIIAQCNAKVTKGDILLTVQGLVPKPRYGSYTQAWSNDRGRGDANRTHDCTVSDCTLYPANLVEEYEDCLQRRRHHVYVSVEKRDSGWLSEKKARANFELLDGEFVNLTYMNSVWLEWVVNNKTLGDWRVGGAKVDYAYAIRYLKTAMDYVRGREADEKALLDTINPAICTDPEWPLKLTEWKMEKGVRVLTAYQAERFAKFLS